MASNDNLPSGVQLMKHIITPVAMAGDYRTGSLERLSKEDIVRILGFEPNVDDDTDKVKFSWGFYVNGQRYGIWDYKGGWRYKEWSTFGYPPILKSIFGDYYS